MDTDLAIGIADAVYDAAKVDNAGTVAALRRLADELADQARAPFPMPEPGTEPECPACGMTGTLRYTQLVYETRTVDAPRATPGEEPPTWVLFTYLGEYDYGHGHDEHVYCRHCMAEYGLPEAGEFEWA